MKLVLILILFTLVGCQEAKRAPAVADGSTYAAPKKTTTKKPTPPVKETNPYKVPSELIKYVDSFYQKMGQAGLNNYRRNIIFLMDPDMKREWAGTCTYAYDDKPAVIRISEYWWYNSDFNRREQTMYHELGHCVLMRGHDSSVNSFNRARSIMSTEGLPYDNQYISYYPDYMAELFKVSITKFSTTSFRASLYYDHPYHRTASTSALRDDYVTPIPAFTDAHPDIECSSH